nr:hypothetical protein [Tanacetum cinerariifolium]
MCIPFTDVAQVTNVARNYEIFYERDDDGTERPDKRQKSDVAQIANAARNYEILHEKDDEDTERPDKRAAAGTAEEQAKNFQWGLRRSTLNHLKCMPFTVVAHVANVARNYEILHERDDDDAERPDKRRGSGDNHRSNNNYSGNNNRNSGYGRDQRNRGQQSNRPANSGNSFPGVPLRANPTRSALRVDADTQESVIELLVPASSVVKLAICRRITRRTPL